MDIKLTDSDGHEQTAFVEKIEICCMAGSSSLELRFVEDGRVELFSPTGLLVVGPGNGNQLILRLEPFDE